jgi:hypothetical protein
VTKALCDARDHLRRWEVTPAVIVLILTSPSVQVRNWEGEQLWHISAPEIESTALSVANEFVFVGGESGTVKEFHLASG